MFIFVDITEYLFPNKHCYYNSRVQLLSQIAAAALSMWCHIRDDDDDDDDDVDDDDDDDNDDDNYDDDDDDNGDGDWWR